MTLPSSKYDQDNDNDSITMDEDPNCTEISCSEINPKLVFNPGHEDADGDGDGDESHNEPESDYMLYISSVTSNWPGDIPWRCGRTLRDSLR